MVIQASLAALSVGAVRSRILLWKNDPPGPLLGGVRPAATVSCSGSGPAGPRDSWPSTW